MALEPTIRALNSQRQGLLRSGTVDSEPGEFDHFLLVNVFEITCSQQHRTSARKSRQEHAIESPTMRSSTPRMLPEGQAIRQSFGSALFRLPFPEP